MVLKGNTVKPLPDPLHFIEHRDWLKLLSVLFQNNPCSWDMHIKHILKQASLQFHILRVCKFYGYATHNLHLLFNSLIMPILYSFLCRAYRFGYTSCLININDVINERDHKLWNEIVGNHDNPLNELLPPQRTRCLREHRHKCILPKVRTERFKRAFINRCLFEPQIYVFCYYCNIDHNFSAVFNIHSCKILTSVRDNRYTGYIYRYTDIL